MRGRQLPHERSHLSFPLSLNLVINYEREIIINICPSDLQRALPPDGPGISLSFFRRRVTLKCETHL